MTTYLPTKTMQGFLLRLLGGESLTVEEQRRLISSHEELRALYNTRAHKVRDLEKQLAAERERVDKLVSRTVEARREENEPRPRVAAKRTP